MKIINIIAHLLLYINLYSKNNIDNIYNVNLIGYWENQKNDKIYNIIVKNDIAYIANNENGIRFIDVKINNINNTFYETLKEIKYFKLKTINYDKTFALELALNDKYSFIAYHQEGLCILDVLNIDSISWIGQYKSATTIDTIRSVDVSGKYAFLASKNTGLIIIDVSIPNNPKYISSYYNKSTFWDIKVINNYVYVAAGNSGIIVFDVSDIKTPQKVGSINTGDALKIDIKGNYAYVANNDNGLSIIEITDPTKLKYIGSYKSETENSYALDVSVEDSLAYVAYHSDGLHVINISDPYKPKRVGSYNFDKNKYIVLTAVYAKNGLCYSGDSYGNVYVFKYKTISTINDSLKIVHQPINVINKGDSLTIKASISSKIPIKNAIVFFRQGGENLYHSLDMINKNNYYYATIQDTFVNNRCIEYYIYTTDILGNIGYFPENNPTDSPLQTIIKLFGINYKIFDQNKNEISKMLSVPFLLNDSSAHMIFDNKYYVYGKEFRLFNYAKNRLLEYDKKNNKFNIMPGNAFWAVSKDSMQIYFGNGSTINTYEKYKILLTPGWNAIGNPFCFNINWKNVLKDTTVISKNPIKYIDSNKKYCGYNLINNYLEPWEGYFIYNSSNSDKVIEIIPKEDKKFIYDDFSNYSYFYKFQINDWAFQIIVSSGRYLDKDNYFGSIKDAKNDWDLYDLIEPPFLYKYLVLYFPPDSLNRHETKYTSDFRVYNNMGITWDFNVETNISQSDIKMQFNSLTKLPLGWNYIIIDKTAKRRIDIIKDSIYTFMSNRDSTKREFRILAGNIAYINSNDLNIKDNENNYSLYQNYPNPLKNETKIIYSIKKLGYLKLYIYNSNGQLVKKLIDEIESPGKYEIIWNGRNTNNEKVSNGIYIYKFETEGYKESKKMVVFK